MATKHTEHYGLSQWELSDSVVMADFNEDNRKIDAALAAGTKIQTGTYTGTGEFGPEHPTSITFDFEPKLVIIRPYDMSFKSILPINLLLWIKGVGKDSLDYNDTARHFTLDGNTLSWYADGSEASESRQMNSNNPYCYAAIG